MTWASLWWRVCLLGRMHRRRLVVTWRLWKRRHRRARPVRLPYNRCGVWYDPTRSITNAEIGSPIPINNYRSLGSVAYLSHAHAQQALMAQQQQMTDAHMQATRGMDRHDPSYLALLSGTQNAFGGSVVPGMKRVQYEIDVISGAGRT